MTAIWTIIVVVHVGSGLNWSRYIDRWLDADSFILPSAVAAAGHLKRLALAGILSAALTGIGALTLLGLRFAPADILEEAVLGYALGYGLVGTMSLILGLAGLWSPGTVKLWSSLVGIAGAIGVILSAARWESTVRASSENSSSRGISSIVIAGVAVVCLSILRYALIPETFYDALVYHLALPSEYLVKGRIFATPSNSFAGVPALPQMISGIALAWEPWGVSAGVIHWSMLPWCCAALFALCRRLKRPRAGVVAVALLAATPVVIGEAFRVSVGLEWAFLQLCCLLSCIALIETGAGSRIGRSLAAGLLLGFTMATKYPAWLVPAAVIALLAAARRSDSAEGQPAWGVGELCFAAAAAALLLAPWIVKNIAFYQNPIFPFLQEKFTPSAAALPDWRQIGGGGPSGVMGWILHPWRFLKPADDVTETIGPAYFALLPALLMAPLGRLGRVLAIFVAAAWLPLSFVSIEPRYFIPHIAALALLVAYLIEGLGEREAKIFRTGAIALSGITALGWFVMDANRGKLPVFTGQKDFPSYVAHTTVSYPAPAFAAYDYLNGNTPAGTRVLVYGDARSYYLQRDALISSPDQASVLERWADEVQDGRQLADRLRSEHVAYIVPNLGEVSRLHRKPRVSEHGMTVLDDFWRRYTQRVFGVMDPGDRWVGVYKVLSEEEARKAHEVDDLFAPYRKKSA